MFQTIKPGCSIGLGVFDGLHRGHQQIACQADYLLSLFPHPRHVLTGKTVRYLTLPHELMLLNSNIDILNFTIEVSQLSAIEFLNDILLQLFKPKKIVVGYDYQFGNQRKGNYTLLKEWGAKHQVEITQIAPFKYKDRLVKSSVIRKLLHDDQFQEAVDLLGHPYLISGEVVHGDGRGKTLGFPTANLKVNADKLVPSKGVYKGYVTIENQRFSCLINIGNNPTFNGHELKIEVHIAHFDRSLYGEKLTVFMTDKIRGEKQFQDKAALIDQIKKDCKQLG